MAKAREERRRARKAKTFRRRAFVLIAVVAFVVALVLFYQFGRPSPEPEPNKILLRTSMGDIKIQLYDDMPITTGNFRKLVKQGVYDGTIFHRVIDGFMIQGGDPTTKPDDGDLNIPTIPDEFTDHNRNDRGTVAMANAGPNTGSSQFFINLVYNQHLDDAHPVFGEVISGMDVVDAIGKVQTDDSDRPVEPVTIISAELVE